MKLSPKSRQKIKDMKHWLFYYNINSSIAHPDKLVGKFSCMKMRNSHYATTMITPACDTVDEIVDEMYKRVYNIANVKVFNEEKLT